MHARGIEGVCYPPGPAVRPDTAGRWLRERVNPANLETAQAVWRLLDEDYVPIDWHLDFKSGFRWSETLWYRDVRRGEVPGADLRVPWELAHGQHLPQLAATCHFLDDPSRRTRLVREFRNQVLDFVATNPPRWGVNWSCTMAVAIRIANWLLARDLFLAAGATFDEPFEEVLYRSVWDHAEFIAAHLEWYPHQRGNHYLSDVVGLLIAAAYLPRCPSTDAWLALAVQELAGETERQFLADGAHFEASTSYHRLAAELVVFGTAFVRRLDADARRALVEYDHRLVKGPPRLQPPCRGESAPYRAYQVLHSAEHDRRLAAMADFTMAITKPNGRIHQVGDNDSGRFLKLHPSWRRAGNSAQPSADDWTEICLDHRHLVAAIGALVPCPRFAAFAQGHWLDEQIVRHLAFAGPQSPPKRTFPSSDRIARPLGLDDSCVGAVLKTLPAVERIVPLSEPAVLRGLRALAFPEFGLYLWCSPRLYLAVRCGRLAAKAPSGHAHNDQLAVELNIDGTDLLADPGSYLYTQFPELRNAYRSIAAHAAPQPLQRKEPCPLNAGLFVLPGDPRCECLVFTDRRFLGRHFGFGVGVWREVRVEDNLILIRDHAPEGFPLRPPLTGHGDRGVAFSPSYGTVEPARPTSAAPSLPGAAHRRAPWSTFAERLKR